MSTYRSSATTFNVNVAGAYDLAEGEYDALLHGMCSINVAALAHDVSAIPIRDPLGSSAAWSRVDAVMPNWLAHLPTASLDAMAAARTGEVPLPAALNTVAIELASQERRAVADTSAAALTELGYTLQRAAGERTSAIEARRGHETFLVVVGEQGSIETDHVGIADDSCNDRQRDFVDAMRRRGVLFDENVNVQHHDPRGGSPVALAARAGGGSLAEGAVIDGDARPSSFVGSLHATTASTPQRVVEGGRR